MHISKEWQDWLGARALDLSPESEIISALVDAGFSASEASYLTISALRKPVVLNEELGIVLHRYALCNSECDYLATVEVTGMTAARSYQPSNKIESDAAHTKCVYGDIESSTHPSIIDLELRISALMGVSNEVTQPFMAIRYEEGGSFGVHADYFDLEDVMQAKYFENGGNRIGTGILYLNDVESGGETEFPHVGVTVKPVKGALLVFWYHNRETRSNHASLPVTKGSKQIVTKWVREFPTIENGPAYSDNSV